MPDLIASTLAKDIRESLGRIHPSLMGGEYLPPLRQNETEIARISLASVTADQISVRARRLKDAIAYRIVDEYPENGPQYQCRPGRSNQPLTLTELVTMMDGASDAGSIVLAPIISNFGCGEAPGNLRDFVQVSSEFYPQLARYYAHRIDAWFEETFPEEVDEPD